MRRFVLPVILLVLGGCAADGREPLVPTPSSNDYLLPPKPNLAPRGSTEFCRTYGRQTAANRLRSSTRDGGRGPGGFDVARAQQEGERAALRCLDGRLN